MHIEGLKGMVEADPKDAESIAELVEWHQGRGEFAAAKEWLGLGLKVNPKDAHLLLLKGDNLVRAGDEEGAIAAFEKAKADPAWERVAQQRIWQLRPPETEGGKAQATVLRRRRGARGTKLIIAPVCWTGTNIIIAREKNGRAFSRRWMGHVAPAHSAHHRRCRSD